jgi:hypothetical protein
LLLWKDHGPLQTLHNQFFRERLHINMVACSVTLVGLSAATPTKTRFGTPLCLNGELNGHNIGISRFYHQASYITFSADSYQV